MIGASETALRSTHEADRSTGTRRSPAEAASPGGIPTGGLTCRSSPTPAAAPGCASSERNLVSNMYYREPSARELYEEDLDLDSRAISEISQTTAATFVVAFWRQPPVPRRVDHARSEWPLNSRWRTPDDGLRHLKRQHDQGAPCMSVRFFPMVRNVRGIAISMRSRVRLSQFDECDERCSDKPNQIVTQQASRRGRASARASV